MDNIDFVRLENPFTGSSVDLPAGEAIDAIVNAAENIEDWSIMVTVYRKGEDKAVGRMVYAFEVGEREDVEKLIEHLANL